VQNFFVVLSMTVFFHEFAGHAMMIPHMLLKIVLIHAIEPARAYTNLEVTNLIDSKYRYLNAFRLN